MTAAELVDACRVPAHVPERRAGPWEIRRYECPEQLRGFAGLNSGASYTALHRDTMATLHRERGEVVMEDTPRELRRHLPMLLAARGRVLISGLGLGCVVRGLLAKPNITHVDVVEIDPAIIELVGDEFLGDPRIKIRLGDAESIRWPPCARWDFAWHDVWSEHESLDLVHARLLARYAPLCDAQGAWQLDRSIKRAWPRPLLGARSENAA